MHVRMCLNTCANGGTDLLEVGESQQLLHSSAWLPAAILPWGTGGTLGFTQTAVLPWIMVQIRIKSWGRKVCRFSHPRARALYMRTVFRLSALSVFFTWYILLPPIKTFTIHDILLSSSNNNMKKEDSIFIICFWLLFSTWNSLKEMSEEYISWSWNPVTNGKVCSTLYRPMCM